MTIKEQLHKYMYRQIQSLLEQNGTSGGRAKFARLRRGAGKIPGENPELWGMFLNEMPEDFLSYNGIPTHAEWAVYLSLTMFALHQQGYSESMHADNISLGRAVAQLMEEPNDAERERVLRRFGPIITAKNMPEFSHHLRAIIQLLASKGIKLDYIKLAEDIYFFQNPESRKKVQLKWGQDFYINNNNNNNKGEN